MHDSSRPPPVLAIGGSASVGKTTVATEIAHRFALSVVHVDDARATRPSFVETTRDGWRTPTDRLVDALCAETSALADVVVGAVGRLLAGARGGVIEGEGIEPALVARWSPDEVRAVFVVEDDRERLWRTFATRPSRHRFLALATDEQHAVVEVNVRYGRWLRDQAEAHASPWLPAHPWSTLATRVDAHWSYR